TWRSRGSPATGNKASLTGQLCFSTCRTPLWAQQRPREPFSASQLHPNPNLDQLQFQSPSPCGLFDLDPILPVSPSHSITFLCHAAHRPRHHCTRCTAKRRVLASTLASSSLLLSSRSLFSLCPPAPP
ncbi:hypothetical protein T310_8871, partial [Rasamsonia emersonii CBS 393.64]